MDLFSTHATSAGRQSRYSAVTESAETTETLDTGEVIRGRVYVGKDRNARIFLVHAVAGAETAIPSHAAATAVASGKVFNADAVAAAFAETGKLKQLAAAVKKLTDAQTAAAAAPK